MAYLLLILKQRFKTVKIIFIVYLIIAMLLVSCNKRSIPSQTNIVQSDTTTIEKVEIKPYVGVGIEIGIGESISLPAFNATVTRINKDSVLVKKSAEVITHKAEVVKFVPTKTVDRSKDKSVKDSQVNSKIKDKSQANTKNKKSGNTRTKEKTVSKTGPRWWGFLFLLVAGFAMWFFYQKFFKGRF